MSCSPEMLSENDWESVGRGFNQLRRELRVTRSVEKLTSFAEAPDEGFREAIALNPNTPTDILRDLSSGTEHVRQAVAENPNTPLDVMENLARDENEYVVASLASNKKIPNYLIEEIANHTNEVVVFQVTRARRYRI